MSKKTPKTGRKATNLTMVAEAAGVSLMTASYALRDNEGSGRISKDTIAKVKEVARRMHYLPNLNARSLRQQKTKVIGVVLGNLRLDWAARVMDGLDGVLGEADRQSMLLLHHWSLERNRRELQTLLMYRVDGIISQPLAGMEDEYRNLAANHIPHVLVSDTLPGVDLPAVTWDGAAAAENLVDHLVSIGRRRIAMVLEERGTVGGKERLKGYRRGLRQAGLTPDAKLEFWCESDQPLDDSPLAAAFAPDANPEDRPDAVLGINDWHALRVMEWLRGRGLRVPEDVAVAGIGNLPQSAAHAASLTTVDEPCERMGAAAGLAIMHMLGLDAGEPLTTEPVPAGSIAVRSSTVTPA